MSSTIDRGSLFQMSSNEFDIRAFLRRRSNTFPTSANDSFDELSDCYEDYDPKDCAFESNSPQKPNRSATNTIIERNVIHRTDRNSIEYRSSTGDSPKTPIQHIHESTYSSSPNNSLQHLQYNSNQWDNPCSPPCHSLLPNMSSPLMTPITVLNTNGLHLPIRSYMNYTSLYTNPIYGNGLFDRHLPNSHLDPFAHLDRVSQMARSHRNAATHAEARHTWSGTLPNSCANKTPVYSCKVFLGGVPWEMTDHDIKLTFSRFGNVNILRPGQHVRLSRSSQNKDKAGYLYLIFESDKQIKSLLNACTHDFSNGGKYYFALNQPRYRPKDVQIIPWNVNDTSYVKSPSARVDANKTVFVGALHGMLTSEGLACILEDLFGGVVYVGIDTDKYKYPIGSGRVTFSTTKAYTKAVMAGFIDVKSNRFQKKIQIDPFLEESNCTNCRTNKGPIFCRDSCMRYLCRVCWDILHSSDTMKSHQPIMRNKSKF